MVLFSDSYTQAPNICQDRLGTNIGRTQTKGAPFFSQNVDEAWPLVIEDHDGKEHEVIMEPGQMVLYESARLVHGRPYPLEGKSYTNLFVHFKPAERWEAAMLGDKRWSREWS